MNIGVILHPYGEKSPGGLGRSIFEMVKAVVEGHPEHTYTIFLKDKLENPLPFSGNFKTVSLEATFLWLYAGKHFDTSLDVHFFFTPIIPLFSRPKKSVVMVFDFAYLEIPTTTWGEWVGKGMLYAMNYISLKRADKILAISHDAAKATEKFFGIPRASISVVYVGYIEPSKEITEIKVPDDFFLFAGVLKERKNVTNIIKGFSVYAKNNPHGSLMIAGKPSGAYYESLKKLVADSGLSDRVTFLGYVTDSQLAYLYSKAKALVFPSLIEGFGMPILEANSVGLPVITSNTGALAEVAGDASLTVDPRSPDVIGNAMLRISSDTALREQLIEKGYARAKEFSWEKAAAGIVSACVGLQTK